MHTLTVRHASHAHTNRAHTWRLKRTAVRAVMQLPSTSTDETKQSGFRARFATARNYLTTQADQTTEQGALTEPPQMIAHVRCIWCGEESENMKLWEGFYIIG